MSADTCSSHEADARHARALARLARQLDIALSDVGLTAAQYRALVLLAGGTSMPSRIADCLALTRPSVSVLLDGLVSRGLVRRFEDPDDRRRVRHDMTDDGLSLLEKADEAIARRLSGLAAEIEPPARNLALEALPTWSEALDRALLKRLGDTGPPTTEDLAPIASRLGGG